MVLNSIEKLIEKYDNGETSLKEEQQLKAYFAQEEVAPHLESYKVMFQYFNRTKQEELFTKDVPLKPKKYNVYKWISVAAVVILMLGIFIPQIGDGPKTFADYSEDEQKMYLETKEALAMLSSNFNQGASSLNALDYASNSFKVGTQNANFVTEFGKSTNKLLKNK